MTDNEDYNPILNEGHRLPLEITDTSFISASYLDTSINSPLDPSVVNNNAATIFPLPVNSISATKHPPDERKIIAAKKRRKKDKENYNNGNLSADESSFTASVKTSTNGFASGNANTPSPSLAKISDDFTTCSLLINLDASASHPDDGNDNTEGQNESFGAENLSCSMLSCNIDHDIPDISKKIQNFQDIISEKDKTIEEMAKMLELAVKYKEQQDIHILRVAEESETLKDKFSKATLCSNPRVHESRIEVENTMDNFELSSYLNPPNEHSLQICRPELSQKETQTEYPVAKSIGISCEIDALTPSLIQEKCYNLQLSSQSLRSEIDSFKSFVSNYFKSVSEINSEEFVRAINIFFQKQNADLMSMKAQYSKDIDYQNNIQIQLREDLDSLKVASQKSLEEKTRELQALTEECNQLSENARAYKLQQENEIQTVQLTNEGIIKNKNDEIRSLTAKNNRLEETLKNYNLEKKREADQIKSRNEEKLNHKNEELRLLRNKVSKLEDAKRNDHKQHVLASRLSPEGSELEGDASIADANSGESHYRLTRTKMDYLKLTPPVECIDDGEILEQSSSSDVPNSVIEDLKLQLIDMEKKYDANRKYLDEQTIEREQERDEYHRTMEDYQLKNEDLRKEIDRLTTSIANQKLEISDYELRLKDTVDTEQDLIRKCERVEDELKSAVDKIFELREIIRDLEEQIDSATVNAIELKEQNQMLSEELDRLECVKKDQDDAMNTSHDTVHTLGGDMIEELQTQLVDITRRLEKKLNEMDNFPWQTRPNSSCSGAISVSTEDISVREFSYINRDKECDPKEAGPLLCDGLRRLDTHFENFVRFQEIIVKKLQDADLRLSHSKKRIEDLENEKLVYQDNARSQINTIADLESRLDQFRFEPSPSVVTLSGLRARVTALTEECEQYKGNLELRTIELQDAINRQAATQAMFERYKAKAVAAQSTASQVFKNSVQTQSQTNINTSCTQTERVPIVPRKVSTAEAGVQTNEFLKNNDKYQYFNRSFELSTIPGDPAPTYSTPNEIVSLQKSSIKNKTLVNAMSFLGGGDSDMFARTPETMRNRLQPSLLGLSGEKSIERFSNKSVSFNMKALEQGRGDRDPEGGMSFISDHEDYEDTPGTSKNAPQARMLDKQRQPTKPGTSEVSDSKDDSNRRNNQNDGQPASGRKGSNDSDPPNRRKSQNESDPSNRRKSPNDSDPSNRRKSQNDSDPSNRRKSQNDSDPSNRRKSQNDSDPSNRRRSQNDNDPSKRREGQNDNDPSNRRKSQNDSDPSNRRKSQNDNDPSSRRKSQNADDPSYESGNNSKNPDEDGSLDVSQPRRISKNKQDGYPSDSQSDYIGNDSQRDFTPDEDKESTLDDAYSNYEDDIHSDSSMDEKRRNSQQKRSLKPKDYLDSSDEERMIAEGRRMSGKPEDSQEDDEDGTSGVNSKSNLHNPPNDQRDDSNYPIESQQKDDQIRKLMARINELEDIIQAVHPDEHDYDKYLLETEIEFDKSGTPIKGTSKFREGLGDGYLEACEITEQDIKDIIAKIESNGLENLSEDERRKLVCALKEKSKKEPEPEFTAPVKKTGEDDDGETYTFAVKAVTDYEVDEDGKRRIINKEILPGDECPDADATEAQKERIAETDRQIEIESMKTQIDQLQKALSQERLRCQQLQDLLAKASSRPIDSAPPPNDSYSGVLNDSIQQRSASNDSLQRQIESLTLQLEERLRNEEQLANELDTAVSYIQQKQAEQSEWNSIRIGYESEIEQLKTQLESAADQLRRRPASDEPSSVLRPSPSALGYLDLYLKARSFRKALIWQKKYLLLTIQGYKDILRASGINYDADLLQKEIVIAPSSVGLADRKNPLTRFKIVAKAMVALARMKYMVSRWKSKAVKSTVANSNDGSPASPSTRVASKSAMNSNTPPTKDTKMSSKSSAGTSITNIPLRRASSQTNRQRNSSVNPRFPNATVNPIEFSNAPSTSDVPRPTASGTTVLSQYLDRFEYLENQLGDSLGRETNRPPDRDE